MLIQPYHAITFSKCETFILVHESVFVRVLKWPAMITPIDIVSKSFVPRRACRWIARSELKALAAAR